VIVKRFVSILLIYFLFSSFSYAEIKGKENCLAASFSGTSVREALQMYADFEKINIVIDSDIKNTIDLSLHCVTSDIIKNSIVMMFNLSIIEENGVYLVSPLQKLKRLNIVQEVVKLSYIESSELVDIYKEYKHIDVIPVSSLNSVFISGLKSDVNKILESIKKLDVPQNQYFIDVQLFSASSSFLKNVGLKINAQIQGGQLGGSVVSEYAAIASSGMSVVYDKAGSLLLRSELQLEETKGESYLVSSPKLVAYENKRASISQGVLIPYQVQLNNGGFKTEFKEAAISIKVTPRPANDDEVFLDIFVSKNSPSTQTPQGVQIETRQISTNVRLKLGSTLMLGGIYETLESDTISGVPWLMDVPYLGWFFRSNNKVTSNQELILLLSPLKLKV